MVSEFLALIAAIGVVFLFTIFLSIQSDSDNADSSGHRDLPSFFFGVIAGIFAIIVFLRGLEYFS